MKRKFKILGCVVASSVLLLSTSVFANPTNEGIADIVARITGKSVEEVVDMRSDGMTYGEIANSSGKLEEFKSETGRDYCNGDGTCNNHEGYHHGGRYGNGNCNNRGYGHGRHHGGRHGNCLNNENCPYNE